MTRKQLAKMDEARSPTAFVGFVPGDAVGLVGARTIALVETDPRSQLVADLRVAIRSDADLDLLTAILVGAGLRSLPALALVQVEGTVVRAILRGDIVLTTQSASIESGEETSAGEVLTWVEHVASDVEHLEIRREGETSELSVFEVSEGVIPAARLQMTVADVHPATGSVPSPVPESLQIPATGRAAHTEAVAQMTTEAKNDEPSSGAIGALEEAGGAEPVGPLRANETVRYDENAGPDVDVDPNGDEPVGSDTDAASDSDPAPVDGGDREHPGGSDDPDSTLLTEEGEVISSDNAGQTLGIADVDLEPAPSAEPLDTGAPIDGSGPGDQPDEDDGYDHLFGATEHRPLSLAGVDDDVADAAAASGLISSIPGGDAPAGGVPVGATDADSGGTASGGDPAAEVGDHDGMTISLAQLRAAQDAGDSTLDPAAHASNESVMAEVVHAISCPSGHLNPPATASCRVCGVEIATQEHVSVPRPVLGVLRFSNGDEYPLVRSILMGRSPKASGTSQGHQLPELITLASPSKELSSTHLEIRLEGWQVLAIDRRSTNGTTVALPGRDPQRLHPGNAIPIVPGTVIDMAEEIQFTYEVTP